MPAECGHISSYVDFADFAVKSGPRGWRNGLGEGFWSWGGNIFGDGFGATRMFFELFASRE